LTVDVNCTSNKNNSADVATAADIALNGFKSSKQRQHFNLAQAKMNE